MSQPDMNQIFAQAQEMQQRLQQAQEEIAATVVEGQAGNGLVKISLRGTGEVQNVSIDPQVVDPEDVDTLQDLVTAAFQDAMRAASELAMEKMGPLSGGGDPFGGLLG